MRLLFCSLAATALVALAPSAAGAATRDYPARDFDHVDLRAAAEVTITTGPRFAVHADGDPRLLQRLTADVRGGTLVLGWQPNSGSVETHNNPLRIAVTMPRVAGAGVSGAGTIAIDRAEAPAFTADVGGAGTIKIGQLRSNRADLTMGGTGTITVAGTTGRVDARVSGVGSIDAARLAAREGRATMSGTGQIRAQVNGPVDVTMSGMGHVEIGGSPRCTVHKSGLGNVRCG
ncbi:head GIN domain-containing protein [Sphingomonas sp. PR090111-T3T-6A]|uniref:head GIN domain-containing protein n=1 Tax=Sphingomonas sp. PR090111-T3T-6A TaxID=685778 RepID=UPI0003A3AEA4|nr:head GIN domain-containing protein [Sphingomonas sp. PR090111-T3T-6A]